MKKESMTEFCCHSHPQLVLPNVTNTLTCLQFHLTRLSVTTEEGLARPGKGTLVTLLSRRVGLYNLSLRNEKATRARRIHLKYLNEIWRLAAAYKYVLGSTCIT